MHARVLMWPAAAAILLIGAGLLCAPAANAQAQPPLPGLSDQSSIPDQKLDATGGTEWLPQCWRQYKNNYGAGPVLCQTLRCCVEENQMAEQHSTIIEFPRGKYDARKDEAENFYRRVRARLESLWCCLRLAR
jgi:hypothetical protein